MDINDEPEQGLEDQLLFPLSNLGIEFLERQKVKRYLELACLLQELQSAVHPVDNSWVKWTEWILEYESCEFLVTIMYRVENP